MGLGTSGGGMVIQNISAGAQFGQTINSGDPLATADAELNYMDEVETALDKPDVPKTPKISNTPAPLSNSSLSDTKGGESLTTTNEGSADKKPAKLQKVVLLNMVTEESLEVLFNPKEFYMLNNTVYDELPGVQAKPSYPTYNSARAVEMGFKLFFDTSEEGTSVMKYISKLLDFQDAYKDKESGEPQAPHIKFMWGDFVFDCMITDEQIVFSKFLPDGTPLRAEASVVLYEKRIPKSENSNSDKDESSHKPNGRNLGL